MDAAVLRDRLPEVTQSLSSAQAAALCSAGIERARKCLQGGHFVRCCHTTHSLFRDLPGAAGVVGSAAVCDPTLRVQMLGMEICNNFVPNGSDFGGGLYVMLHEHCSCTLEVVVTSDPPLFVGLNLHTRTKGNDQRTEVFQNF